MPTKIGDLLPARAGGWQLNQTSPRVWCGGRLVGACRIDFFLFSLSLPRRWMRAVLKRQWKEDDRASGTSNEVSARPNTRESDDCEGAVRCEPVGGPLDQSEPTQKAPSLSKLVRTRIAQPLAAVPLTDAARFLFDALKRKRGCVAKPSTWSLLSSHWTATAPLSAPANNP